jgi:hypothetical protein
LKISFCKAKTFGYRYALLILLLLAFTCQAGAAITREEFNSSLADIGKNKYQTHLVCKEVGETIWIYLPYTSARSGIGGTKEEKNDLYLEYQIASFNPFRTADPPELKFLVQKIVGEIRGLLLNCSSPYKFFVLVVTNISSPLNTWEDWYIGYIQDVKDYYVGKDFSGEGYARMTWSLEEIKLNPVFDKEGNPVLDEKGKQQQISEAFRDTEGKHVAYHEMTFREFVPKQIKWRIYKRFTIEYNKTPFDVTEKEKKDEVVKIIQKVFKAYNFSEFENIYLRDMSFLDEHKVYTGYTPEQLERYRPEGINRKPAF